MNSIGAVSPLWTPGTVGNSYIRPDAQENSDVIEKVAALTHEQEVPAEVRFDLLMACMRKDPEHAELVPSRALRRIVDHDLAYMRNRLQTTWKNQERAQAYLERIDSFVADHPLARTITFQQHAQLFFFLSAIISGIEQNSLQEAYEKQIKTMVSITVHPLGEWSVCTELENQDYAKYFFHVSGDGLAAARLLNKATACRAALDQKYQAVRLIGVPCDEVCGFDGVEDTGSVAVVWHDFIHTGFLKRTFMQNPEKHVESIQKVGRIWDKAMSDQTLICNTQLECRVQAAWFMWGHELTTSPFVDGWPRQLPKAKWYLGGIHASRPQILLRIGAKIGYIPELFKNEIKTEQGLLTHLGLKIKGPTDPSMSAHEQTREIMQELSPGYEYLRLRFHAEYGYRSRWSVLWNRLGDIFLSVTTALRPKR